MVDYDIIIVGGGISGLMSALVLSKHGKNVLVLEKENFIGGNCRSYDVNGFQVDTGVHAITHLKVGPLRRLMDEYFTQVPVFLDHGHYYVRYEKGITKIPSNIGEFVTFEALPRKDRLLLSQALTLTITQIVFGMCDTKQSIYEALPKGMSDDTYDFVDAIAYFLSGKSMKETSIERLLYGSSFLRDSVSEDIFKKAQTETSYTSMITEKISNLGRLATNKVAYAQAYPRGGLKSFLNSVLYSMPKTVKIITNSKVEEIVYEGEKVIGVATENDFFSADTVVYSGFVKTLNELVELPSDYIQTLSRIEQTLSLTIWLGLKEKIKEFDYKGSEVWFKDGAYWAMPISNYDSCIAPKGKQLIGFTYVIKDKKNIEYEKKKAFELILKAIPNIENKIEMTHYQITIPEKAAVTTNSYFSGPTSPLKNLYLVGTDTDKRSMGITRAGYSVLELLKAMRDDKKL